MSILSNKIDFALVFAAECANVNGDPLNGNRPREDLDGYGEMSDVCIKRKIRNRLQDMGEDIFVQSEDRSTDGYKSLKERAENNIQASSDEEYSRMACELWIDVRAFGQVFAFKDGGKKGSGISVGIRGPVSVRIAKSVSPITIVDMRITKSVNGEPDKKNATDKSSDGMSSDRMGMKHFVDFGVYVIKGSINPQLAEKTGFSDDDAEKIKSALKTLFENDCSAARPDGSMQVCKLVWWKHDAKIPRYSSAKVHNSITVNLKKGCHEPRSIQDYDIIVENLDGLTPEIFDLI